MSAAATTPSRRRGRAAWRGLRIAALLLVLLGLAGVFYLHQAGVPGWVRERVTDTLRRHGLTLSFARLRLRLDRGLVAEEVALVLPHQPGIPEVRFGQVILEPDWAALLRRRVFEPRSLVLRQGRATVSLTQTNAPQENLVVEDLAARVRFAEAAVWRLEEFTARTLAATWQVRGTLTNGPTLWQRPRPTVPGATAPAAPWRAGLQQIQHTLAALRFASPPAIRLDFSGDAQQPGSWAATVRAHCEGVYTPWGRGEQVQVHGGWSPSTSQAGPTLQGEVALASFSSRWGRLRDVRLRLAGAPAHPGSPEPVWTWEGRAEWLDHPALQVHQPQLIGRTTRLAGVCALHTTAGFSAAAVHAPGAEATRLEGNAVFEHAPAWQPPRRLSGQVKLQHLRRGEAAARELALNLEGEAVPEVSAPADSAPVPDWVQRLAPFGVRFAVQAVGLTMPGLVVDELRLGARWRYPELGVTNLQARLLDGRLQLTRGRLEVPTREASVDLALDFDLQKLGQLLPRSTLDWLAQFQYPTPPRIAAAARVRLPPGRGVGPDALQQMRRTLVLHAQVDGRDARYRGLQCASAGVTINVSNEVLRLYNLELVRPEGRAALAYDLDLRTRDFRWRVDCALDPRVAAPAVDDSLPPVVEWFEFATPPSITGEVWGSWNPPKPVDFALRVTTTNFTFRGEAFDTLSLGLGKTNGVLTFSDVHLTRGPEWLAAPRVDYDLSNRVVTLTRVLSRMDPQVLARCIGPGVAATLEPYRFEQPPLVRVGGTVPVDAPERGTALDFEIEAGPFRTWRIHSPHLTTGVRWRGGTVSVTNLAAAFYGGRLSGGLDLDLRTEGAPTFRFEALATEFDLQSLMRDLFPNSTNRLEGTTTVALIVTDAQTADWHSWHGRGQVELRNGLLWDLPIFGLLSRALNLVVPGLGNSRATGARASFRIQRRVIYTDDLAIEAGPARLQYRGTVDFDGQVDARVVAEVLHRAPIIGPLISLALAPVAKVFEYKITGTLWQPELRPLYVPGFLRPLLNPLGTLQNLVTPSAPPAPPPEPKP